MTAENMKTITVSIYRYDPEKDEKPYMKDYDVEVPAERDIMLLNVLLDIKAKDPSFAFRHSCREGICGSDGMNVNGKNSLACVTPISALKQPIVVRPLPGFPIIRDIVVDMTEFYRQYERIEPYLQNSDPLPSTERLQSPEDRAKLDGLYECILCACCTSSCPSFWWNPDKFVGPAGLLQSYRFIADSRDTAKNERLEKLEDPFSVFRCRSVMNCADVCPKGLNPTAAIGHIREEMMNEKT